MHRSSSDLAARNAGAAIPTAATSGLDTFATTTAPVTQAAVAQAAAPRAKTPRATVEAPPLTRREARERAAKAAARPARSTAATRGKRVQSASTAAAVTPATPVKQATIVKTAAAVKSAAPSRSAKSGKKAPGFKHRLFSRLVTVGAMAGVGLILVSTTVPANAFVRPEMSQTSVVSSAGTEAKAQELKVEAVAAPAIARDGYTVVSPVKIVEVKVSNRTLTYNFTNNPTSAVQWPFPGGAPIASGFGPRQVSGCGFCSTNHLGLDFTPGSGVPIQAIAGGVVSGVSVSGGGFGNSVVVDHVINGQKVQSLYAHMQYGSIQVAVGQQIGVGEMIGAVGSTGASTGAHLHLEVHLDGTPVDPFAWLQANAG